MTPNLKILHRHMYTALPQGVVGSPNTHVFNLSLHTSCSAVPPFLYNLLHFLYMNTHFGTQLLSLQFQHSTSSTENESIFHHFNHFGELSIRGASTTICFLACIHHKSKVWPISFSSGPATAGSESLLSDESSRRSTDSNNPGQEAQHVSMHRY